MVQISKKPQEVLSWIGLILVLVGPIMCIIGFTKFLEIYPNYPIFTQLPNIGIVFVYHLVYNKSEFINLGLTIGIIGAIMLIFLKINEKFMETE